MRILVAVAAVWGILFAVPFVIYGAASEFVDLKPPGSPAWRFLLSVAITKCGTAAAFVALFAFSRETWRDHWLLYAGIWFLAFAISEIGDLVKPGYSGIEATLGIVSEAVYAPLSAFTMDRLLH